MFLKLLDTMVSPFELIEMLFDEFKGVIIALVLLGAVSVVIVLACILTVKEKKKRENNKQVND